MGEICLSWPLCAATFSRQRLRFGDEDYVGVLESDPLGGVGTPLLVEVGFLADPRRAVTPQLVARLRDVRFGRSCSCFRRHQPRSLLVRASS